MRPKDPYNPLDLKNLAQSIEGALLKQPLTLLEKLERFEGSGIYLLYYSGDFLPYAPISLSMVPNKEVPIYVGRAVPSSARKGQTARKSSSSFFLHRRLMNHLDSISKTKNLKPSQFHVRYLIIQDIWVHLAESAIIDEYRPVWNQCIDGFGNHAPGSGRGNQVRSMWDTLHPGRDWADGQKPCKLSKDQIIEEICKHFEKISKTK